MISLELLDRDQTSSAAKSKSTAKIIEAVQQLKKEVVSSSNVSSIVTSSPQADRNSFRRLAPGKKHIDIFVCIKKIQFLFL